MDKPDTTLIIADDQLEGLEGHPYEYDKAVQKIFRERDVETFIFGNSKLPETIQKELGAKPWYTFNSQSFIRKIPGLGPVLYRLGFWKKYEQQLDNLIALIANKYAHPLIFIPNVYWYNILPIARSLKKTNIPAAVLYRISIYDTIQVPGLFKPFILPLIKHAMEKIKKESNVYFFSDSTVIAGEWQHYFNCRMRVLPIPHLLPNRKKNTPAPGEKIRFYLPGGMRLEKGAALLTEALELLQKTQNKLLQKITLVTQFTGNDSKLALYKERLAALPIDNIFLERLSTEDYNEQLKMADVILIPYQVSEGYRARTSGILAEAIASCKPFITTNGTWMSDQAQKFNTGMIAEDRQPETLAQAISDIINTYPEQTVRAQTAADLWMQAHDPSVFFMELNKAMQS